MTADSAEPRSTMNVEIALRRLNGDHSLLVKMAEYFLEDAPPLVEKLRQAVHPRNNESLIHDAHSLRGLAGTFEATQVTKLTLEIEQGAATLDEARLRELVATLESEFARLMDEIQALVKK